MSQTTPFLKWAGGKRQMLDQYDEFFPDNFETYHEPMVGGGAVFFHLQPSEAILSDINRDLIITYQAVKENVDELIELLKGFAEKHSKDFYYQRGRAGFNQIKKEILEDDIDSIPLKKKTELAAHLIYLNKTCFNGLYRVNGGGSFNVPIGSYKNPTICNEENLRKASEDLEVAKILHGDFREVIKKVGEKNFVYFDPPYDPLDDTSNFTDYTEDGFGKKDQKDLAETFSKLSDKGAKVMLSNSNTEFIRELYSDYNIHEMKANRYINSDGDGRGELKELLITNY